MKPRQILDLVDSAMEFLPQKWLKLDLRCGLWCGYYSGFRTVYFFCCGTSKYFHIILLNPGSFDWPDLGMRTCTCCQSPRVYNWRQPLVTWWSFSQCLTSMRNVILLNPGSCDWSDLGMSTWTCCQSPRVYNWHHPLVTLLAMSNVNVDFWCWLSRYVVCTYTQSRAGKSDDDGALRKKTFLCCSIYT